MLAEMCLLRKVVLLQEVELAAFCFLLEDQVTFEGRYSNTIASVQFLIENSSVIIITL